MKNSNRLLFVSNTYFIKKRDKSEFFRTCLIICHKKFNLVSNRELEWKVRIIQDLLNI